MQRPSVMRLAAVLLAALGFDVTASGCSREPTQTGPAQPAEVPQRIVSLAPGITEILFALGVGDRVVGVTDWCDYPPAAKDKPSVGGYINFSIEKVVGLEPDLAIGAHGIDLSRLERLESLGIRTYAEDPKTFEDVIGQIERIGRMVGAQQRARDIAARMRRDIRDVTSRVAAVAQKPKPRVMYGSWEAPVFVAGPDNFIDEAIRTVGGANIAADAGTPWPTGYSIEKIVAHDPQVMVRGFNPTHGGSMGERARDVAALKNDAVWGTIAAVRTGRVHWMNENLLVRPGPRLTEGLKQIGRFIHPDLFPSRETQP